MEKFSFSSQHSPLDCLFAGSSPLRTKSSAILFSCTANIQAHSGNGVLMVRIVFFPAAFIWLRMLTDKAMSNTQEKRYEYLNSFLNTELNTLTIQTMFLPFYYHVVKCRWTKCVPAHTKGTNQQRVLGPYFYQDSKFCDFLQVIWSFFVFFKWSLCWEALQAKENLICSFKYNSNIKKERCRQQKTRSAVLRSITGHISSRYKKPQRSVQHSTAKWACK